jgi:hypothetical protein
MLWLIPFAVALCIVGPPLLARALKNRLDKRADQDCIGAAGFEWVDVPDDFPTPPGLVSSSLLHAEGPKL